MLTTILFLHCTLHPDVSYRQVCLGPLERLDNVL